MGSIFSYEDIVTGNVPGVEDFSETLNGFCELSETAVREGDVTGTVVYGSVALGAAGPRSDFDSMIVLQADNWSSMHAARRLIQETQAVSDGRVPLQPIVLTRDELRLGEHHLDRFFGLHLGGACRIVIGEDPATVTAYRSEPAVQLLEAYIDAKRRKLRSAFVGGQAMQFEQGNGIQRMLELPQAVGRKLIQALHEVGYLETAIEAESSRGDILERAGKLFEHEGVGDGFEALVWLDKEYSTTLARALKGEVSEGDYNRLVANLHAELPSATRWLWEVRQEILPKLAASR